MMMEQLKTIKTGRGQGHGSPSFLLRGVYVLYSIQWHRCGYDSSIPLVWAQLCPAVLSVQSFSLIPKKSRSCHLQQQQPPPIDGIGIDIDTYKQSRTTSFTASWRLPETISRNLLPSDPLETPTICSSSPQWRSYKQRSCKSLMLRPLLP